MWDLGVGAISDHAAGVVEREFAGYVDEARARAGKEGESCSSANDVLEASHSDGFGSWILICGMWRMLRCVDVMRCDDDNESDFERKCLWLYIFIRELMVAYVTSQLD